MAPKVRNLVRSGEGHTRVMNRSETDGGFSDPLSCCVLLGAAELIGLNFGFIRGGWVQTAEEQVLACVSSD